MVCGGFDDAGPVREVEIYRPASDSWTTLPAAGTATVDRNYHSVALLMPDGRVWTAGGNDRGDWSYHNSAQYENQTPPRPLPTTAQDPGVDNRETQIELFEPPYYTRPDRPSITSAPSFASYGSTFTIRTPDAAVISRVALIRAGSVTHAFNGDQRYVGLRFTSGTDELYATAPPDGNVAPPGQYLLFIVSLIGEEAVPSVGTFVRVDWRPKVLKELKAELKEFEVPVDIPGPKLIREMFDPTFSFIIDPPPLIRLLAERVDDLEDRLAQGVGHSSVPRSARR